MLGCKPVPFYSLHWVFWTWTIDGQLYELSMGALSSILVGLGMQVASLMFVGVWAPTVRRSHPLLPFAWFYAFLPPFYIAEPAFFAVFTTFLSLPKLLANMQFTSFFFFFHCCPWFCYFHSQIWNFQYFYSCLGLMWCYWYSCLGKGSLLRSEERILKAPLQLSSWYWQCLFFFFSFLISPDFIHSLRQIIFL